MATGIPHVDDLAEARAAEAKSALMRAQQQHRPAVPKPESLKELYDYLKTDGPIKLRAWLQTTYEPPDKHKLGMPLQPRYPAGYGRACNFLVAAKQQSGYPSYMTPERIDLDHAVAEFERDGNHFFCWLYLQAFVEHTRQQVEQGQATRKDLTAAIEQTKPYQATALRQAQAELKPFGG